MFNFINLGPKISLPSGKTIGLNFGMEGLFYKNREAKLFVFIFSFTSTIDIHGLNEDENGKKKCSQVAQGTSPTGHTCTVVFGAAKPLDLYYVNSIIPLLSIHIRVLNQSC